MATWCPGAMRVLYPDSKVHWANMGPIWVRQAPGGPHVSPMNFAIWVGLLNPYPINISMAYTPARILSLFILLGWNKHCNVVPHISELGIHFFTNKSVILVSDGDVVVLNWFTGSMVSCRIIWNDWIRHKHVTAWKLSITEIYIYHMNWHSQVFNSALFWHIYWVWMWETSTCFNIKTLVRNGIAIP